MPRRKDVPELLIDEELDGTFPASDPTSTTPFARIGTPARPERDKDEPGATVDEQIEDSFPASDPPSYNAGGRVGRPERKSPKSKEPATKKKAAPRKRN
jgi:hypothetical protein